MKNRSDLRVAKREREELEERSENKGPEDRVGPRGTQVEEETLVRKVIPGTPGHLVNPGFRVTTGNRGVLVTLGAVGIRGRRGLRVREEPPEREGTRDVRGTPVQKDP